MYRWKEMTTARTKKKNMYVVSACENGKEKLSVCMERVIDATSTFIKRYVRHEFEENRSVKITIESYDVDGYSTGYIEFSIHGNRFETDNFGLIRMLEEAIEHVKAERRGKYIAFSFL
jgi:hypothetical protein